MSFEWDERKRKINLEKHGLDFITAIGAFSDPLSVEYRSRVDTGEERCVLIGSIGPAIIAVVYTVRHSSIRIISARMARPAEKARWNEIAEIAESARSGSSASSA